MSGSMSGPGKLKDPINPNHPVLSLTTLDFLLTLTSQGYKRTYYIRKGVVGSIAL